MRTSARLKLIITLCIGFPCLAAANAELVASLNLSSDVEGFGGFSGLEISDDGTEITAVSDKGRIMRGQILRDANDNPIGVTEMRFAYVLGPNGARMQKWREDAEGLAIDNRGRLYVSFEGEPGRVWRYDRFGGAATELPHAAFMEQMQPNSGLEGLAVDRSGSLFSLPERSGQLNRPFPVWRYRNGQWDQPFSVPRHPPHLTVGLDIGPDNRLYLLERHFSGISFRTRIRRFDVVGDALQNERILLDTPSGTHLNLEGISVWRDVDNVLRITMIADDNFRSFLNTTLVEYRFPSLP